VLSLNILLLLENLVLSILINNLNFFLFIYIIILMNKIKISNISNKSKINFPEKIKYSNAVKYNIPMEVKKITINQWLKYYGLQKYNIYFGNCESYIYGFSIFNKIKQNVDLLHFFFSVEDFFEYIKHIVVDYYYIVKYSDSSKEDKANLENFINADLYKFYNAYNLLRSKKYEYKKIDSIFGKDANNAEYLKLINTKGILDFLDAKFYRDNNIYKEDIFEKLKLLDFEDILYVDNSHELRLYLSVDIQLLKIFNFITKHKENIKNGCNKSITKKDYDKFVENNKYLEYLLSCDNKYTLENMKTHLKELTPEEFMDIKRLELFSLLVYPLKDKNGRAAYKIYTLIFPSSSDLVVYKRLSMLSNIPKSKLNKKKKKFRIFFINAHGATCYLDKYKDDDRFNITNFLKEYNTKFTTKKEYIKNDNLTIINSQPVGRLSALDHISSFNEIFSSFYRINVLKSLLNAYKREHFTLIERLFNIFIYKYFYKNLSDIKSLNSFEKELDKLEEKSKIFSKKVRYNPAKTNYTTEDMVNFTKYNYQNNPPDVEYTLEPGRKGSPLLGIFELNKDNEPTIRQFNKLLISHDKAYQNLSLGLVPEELYNYRSEIPNDYEEVFKYNMKIKYIEKTRYYLDDFIKIILDNADIKEDEQIIIFSNHCRGLTKLGKTIEYFNTIHHFSPGERKRINKLRKNSINKAYTLKPNNLSNSLNSLNSPPSNLKKSRRKRGTKRKGAKRSKFPK
jgi:hypothetical protein